MDVNVPVRVVIVPPATATLKFPDNLVLLLSVILKVWSIEFVYVLGDLI